MTFNGSAALVGNYLSLTSDAPNLFGKITVAAGGTLAYANYSGRFSLNDGLTIADAGNVVFSGGTATILGNVAINSSAFITGGSVNAADGATATFQALALSNGAITGPGSVTIAGPLTWTGEAP